MHLEVNTQLQSVVLLPKCKFESNHEETSNKPKLKGILKRNWPELFKKCQCDEKQRLSTCFRLKETKEA